MFAIGNTQNVDQEERGMNSVIAALPREVIKRDGRQAIFDATKNTFGHFARRAGQREFAKPKPTCSPPRWRSADPQIPQAAAEHRAHPGCGRAEPDRRQPPRYRACLHRLSRNAQELREDRKTLVDVEASINEYLSRQDWRVNANANRVTRWAA